MSQLRNKAISSLSWQGLSQFIRIVFRFIIGIILARLLTPQDFGIVGMVTIITGYARIVSNFGLGAALIQVQETDEVQLSSVFWLNLALGISMTAAFILCAPLISQFYGEIQLIPIVFVIAFSFTIDTACTLHKVLYRKQIEFKAIAKAEMFSIIGSSLIAISMALMEYGVWSLVGQVLANSLIMCVYLWWTSSWRPHFIFHWSAIQHILSFGIGIWGTQTLNYWTQNIDNLLIGRIMGAGAMGIYTHRNAYKLDRKSVV